MSGYGFVLKPGCKPLEAIGRELVRAAEVVLEPTGNAAQPIRNAAEVRRPGLKRPVLHRTTSV